jgi:hypothetical protein
MVGTPSAPTSAMGKNETVIDVFILLCRDDGNGKLRYLDIAIWSCVVHMQHLV